MSNLQTTIDYILTWLCYGDEALAKRVAYTADEKELENYDVIIVPNGHFGQTVVLPDLKPVVVEQPAKNKAIIRTDIVYNTFFFTSRAEEIFNTERDTHGRFVAVHSLLGYNNRMLIPSLDENARLLLKLLNAPLPTPGFNRIYLTHDIDAIARYRNLKGAIGGLKKGQKEAVLASIRDIHNDPYYTFPWLIEQDARVPDAQALYFIKYTQGKGFDYPQYNLHGRDFKQLKKQLAESGAKFGTHSSYYEEWVDELGRTPKAAYPLHRTHYLRLGIRQMLRLTNAGVTDDFTMGFADQVGFRLQTTRAVRWINPFNFKLTPLTLHPLIIMDTTLSNPNYMNLTEDEAYFVCEQLINKVRMHHGDLCILWHNSNLTSDTYHRSLYPKILQLINAKS